MRIVFTGGGSGGHFYPIVAIAEAVRDLARERTLLEPTLYFFGPNAHDERALYDLDVHIVKTPSGKLRRYFSFLNITDVIAMLYGIIKTLFVMYQVYPDVVFSKGGYGAMPSLIAARILNIPVVVHESDAVPGRATLFAAPFAKRIAVAFDDAAMRLPEAERAKTALTGNPVRKDVAQPSKSGAHEFLDLEHTVPVVFIMGGSQGAEALNEAVLSALPELIQRYQIIHQTGEAHIKSIEQTASVVLDKNEKRYRYHPYAYLNPLALRMAAGVSELVISRAGAGAIAEIAAWGIASIMVPLPTAAQDHQRYNAFAYARAGGCIVLEQQNLTPHLLVAEIDRLFTNPKGRADLADAAKRYARPDAARTIGNQLIDIALEHA